MTSLTVRVIAESVAIYYGLEYRELISERRPQVVVVARQTAAWLARQRTRYSLTRIGICLGKRHHSTIIHAIETAESRMASDAAYAAEVSSIGEILDGIAQSVAARKVELKGDIDAMELAEQIVVGHRVDVSRDQLFALAVLVLSDRGPQGDVADAMLAAVRAGRGLVAAADRDPSLDSIPPNAIQALREALVSVDRAQGDEPATDHQGALS